MIYFFFLINLLKYILKTSWILSIRSRSLLSHLHPPVLLKDLEIWNSSFLLSFLYGSLKKQKYFRSNICPLKLIRLLFFFCIWSDIKNPLLTRFQDLNLIGSNNLTQLFYSLIWSETWLNFYKTEAFSFQIITKEKNNRWKR